MDEKAAGAEARAAVEQLLYRYTAAADELDVEALTRLLRGARLDFAGRSGQGEGFVAALFRDLFTDAPRVRHLVSNVRVWEAADNAGAAEVAMTCRYMRWRYEPRPELLSMGDYSARLTEDDGQWTFRHFQVKPLWTAPPPRRIR